MLIPLQEKLNRIASADGQSTTRIVAGLMLKMSIGLLIQVDAPGTLRIIDIDGTESIRLSGVVYKTTTEIPPTMFTEENLDTTLFATVEMFKSAIILGSGGSIIKKIQVHWTDI